LSFIDKGVADVQDEATSALDATSRVVVFEAIKKWRTNRTTIVITHDLSQIVSHDFVYVMKNGVVAEQGFRSDLMAKGPMYGVFASLAAEQAVVLVPPKHEEYYAYEGSFMEILDGDDDHDYERPSVFGGLPRPVSRIGGLGSVSKLRPPSVAYFDILDEYARGSRVSVMDDGKSHKRARPMSIAQKRLSWAPKDLVAPPRPGSRMSYISRPSYEGTPSISIRRPSVDSGQSNGVSPYQVSHGKDPRNLSTLSHRSNARSQDTKESVDDLKVIDIVTDSDSANRDTSIVMAPRPTSVIKLILSHIPNLPSKHLLIIGILASIGHGICTPFWSNYLAGLMNVVGQGGSSPTLTQNTLIVLSLCFGQGISNLIQDWSLFSLSAIWTAKLRSQTFGTVLAQDRRFFDESVNAPSSLVQIIIKDIDDMRNLMAQVVGKAVVFIVMVGMGLIWAMIVQWRMTLVGLSVGPALAAVVVLNESMVGKAEVRNKLKREAVAKTFYEVSLQPLNSKSGR
jgi:ATP-binding cassette subfamily B (MDR/TAP) protein 1